MLIFLVLRIAHPQHQVGIRGARPRPAYTFLFYGIFGFANSRGVNHRHWITVDIELDLDNVARGAGVRRDDRHLPPRQRIHQRRLAHIRRACDRNHQPFRSRSLRPCAASTCSISPSSVPIFASAGAISSAGTSPSSEKSTPPQSKRRLR